MDSLSVRLKAIDRSAKQSITRQIVEIFTDAIATGEIAPGQKLPTTRQLAQMAGVNPLTAGRSYRHLQERGLVISVVGRGTFVRASPKTVSDPSSVSWQVYALPAPRGGQAGKILGEASRLARKPELIALSNGNPAPQRVPLEDLARATREALEQEAQASFEYSPIEGSDELRLQLAALGRDRGLDDDADSILVTTGARQALTLAARAVLRAGDLVACESPTYPGIIEALRATGATVMPIDVDEDGFDVEALERLLRGHDVRLVALQPRGHNPTGRDLTERRRARLIELASSHDFFVLEDAVYADLRYEGADLRSLRTLDRSHVIYVDSLSKTVSTGLRAGWVAASGPVLDRIIAEKRDDDAASASLPQQVAARYLAAGLYPSHRESAREFYRERRDALVGALEAELSGVVRFLTPSAGGHVWLTLSEPREDAELLRAAQASGVSYIPGGAMLVGSSHSTHLRLSFTTVEPELLCEGVRRLAEVIRAQPPATLRRHTLPTA